MEVERITLAVTDMEVMAGFYDSVFDTALAQTVNGPFRTGHLAGIPLLLCPNDIAGVDARQNRHQFRIAVEGLGPLLDRTVAAGGAVLDGEDRADGRRVVGIRDPEGNTYELVESAVAGP